MIRDLTRWTETGVLKAQPAVLHEARWETMSDDSVREQVLHLLRECGKTKSNRKQLLHFIN
jgi:hypothetical protein